MALTESHPNCKDLFTISVCFTITQRRIRGPLISEVSSTCINYLAMVMPRPAWSFRRGKTYTQCRGTLLQGSASCRLCRLCSSRFAEPQIGFVCASRRTRSGVQLANREVQLSPWHATGAFELLENFKACLHAASQSIRYNVL